MEITETIKSYYENILQRSASDDEANFWAEKVDAGEYDLEQVRDAFINSPEGQHVQDIVRLYQGSFNRVPDAGGLKSWVQSGRPLDEIAEGFTNSDEFHKLYETNDPSEAFITSLYRNVLGREPDSEGLSNWMNSGLSAHQILIGFTESVEFRGDAGAWVGKFLDRAGEGKSVYEGTLYNDAPVAGDAVELPSMEEDGGSVTFTAAELLANVKDYDADDVTVKSVAPVDPAAGELMDNGDGTWTFTPAADYNGIVTFDVVVTDGELDTPTSATLEVTAVNDAPVGGEPVMLDAMEEDGTITITAEQLLKNVVNVDGDSLSLVVKSDSGNLVDNLDGTWTFTPDTDFNGTVNFSVTVSDASGEWDETTASLEVTPVNDAPVIMDAETDRITGMLSRSIDFVGVTQSAVVSDAEGNFAGGSVRVDVSGKFENDKEQIFFASVEGDEIVGKFYLVGTNVVMRADVAGNTVDTVVGTYKTGFVDLNATTSPTYVAVHDVGEATYATITLNGNATAEVVTEMLKNIRLGMPADEEGDLNVKVTVTDGDGKSADFTRLLDMDGEATITEEGDLVTSDVEVELAQAKNKLLAADPIDFNSNGSVMNGGTITVTGDNWHDTLRLVGKDASLTEGQARFIKNVDGTFDVSVNLYDEDEEELVETVIGTTPNLPVAGSALVITLNKAATDEKVTALLNSLSVDLDSELGKRTFTVVYESAKGPNDLVETDRIEVSFTHTLVGDFEDLTFAALSGASVATPVTIDSNVRLTIGAGNQTLDIAKAIEDKKVIVSGEGYLVRLIVAGTTDLTAVKGLDKLGDYSFYSTSGALTVTAEQADGRKGTVTGSMNIEGVASVPGIDLSNLKESGPSSSIIANLSTTSIDNTPVDVTFTGKLGDAELDVTGLGKLIISAELASEKTIDAVHDIVITDLGDGEYDLDDITSDGLITATVDADLTLNSKSTLGDLQITVAQNVTLTLTAEQASGQTIEGGDVNGNGNKGGSVIVTDLSSNVDLSNISDSDILGGATNATNSDLIVLVTGKEEAAVDGVLEATSLNLGFFIVKIEEGATLKTDGSSISGESIQGDGSIIVEATGSSINVDLSKVTVTGDKTLEVSATGPSDQPALAGGAKIGDFKVLVDHGATFTLSSEQADGKTITGADAIADDPATTLVTETADAGSVVVNLDGAKAYDLTGVKAGAASSEIALNAGTLTAIVTDDVSINSGTKLGDFAIELRDGPDGTTDASLTLSASQASGRMIMVGSTVPATTASVTVTGLAADTDLSKVAAAAKVTANVVGDLDISSNAKLLGHVDVYKVIDAKVLTLSALQANGIEISRTNDSNDATAEGTVVIAGDVVADTDGNGIIDGTEQPVTIDLTKVDLGFSFDDGSINVGTGVTLKLTADQPSGKVITGEGIVTVTGLGDDAVDLSKITVTGTKTVETTGTHTLNSATKLGTFGVDIDTGSHLTVTSAQAMALDKIVGDTGSTLTIEGTSTIDNLDFSGKTGWSFSSLTINGSGGDDYLKAPMGVGSVTFTGGLGSDNFDVQNGKTVTVSDFSLTADELNIDLGGIARINVAGTADLSASEAADRLSNKGTLEINGSAGADIITASSGNDMITGGLGNDTFVFKASSSSDTINGFDLSAEKIDLTAFTEITSLTDLVINNDTVGNKTVISHVSDVTDSADLQITLVGIAGPTEELTASHFKFYTPTP